MTVTGDRETAGVERWRHLKRGTVYEVLGEAGLQSEWPQSDGQRLTVYRGEDGQLWARPPAEFLDGRFERIATPPSGGGDHAAPEAGGGALSLDGLDAAEASYDAHADRHGHPRCDPTALQDAIDDYLTVAATARPAGAEGSAEVSCKENGGSAATTDASCKAAEPVTSGKLRLVFEEIGDAIAFAEAEFAGRGLDREAEGAHFALAKVAEIRRTALSPTRDASDGEGE